jgi:hypothetical protein
MHSLDRPRHEVGIGHEGVALLGVAQQGDGPVADQAGGGVVSGDDQLEDRGEQLLLRQCTVALRGDDEVGHEIHARLRALAVEQRGEVAGDAVRGRHGRGRRLRPGVRGEQVGEPAAQIGPVRLRDPEQLADHRERQREREARHQVDRLVRTAGRQRGEQVVHDRPDPGLQCGDSLRGERGHRQPPQPGVVRRVDGEHVAGEGGPGQALRDDLTAVGERGVHVLGQPRVVQRCLRLVVADHQPGGVPVGEPHLVHRGRRTNLRKQRERVVAVVVTPRVERRMARARLL